MGDSYGNSESVEHAWAYKAMGEADTHYNIITSVDPDFLTLSEQDDKIYEEFRSSFPDFDINMINEDEMKSAEGKKKWRTFCNKFDSMQNFNYGCLVRINPMEDYNANNCTFATHIQYLAIEIARNREGITKKLYCKALAERRARRLAGVTSMEKLKSMAGEITGAK
uniref:Protein PBDC1 n=1 Tax=Phallusia mammillata TaxID=59560 RepID=A0A6F9DNG6_9ASCI|nr:protein PBDC1 [Phallusia mammillata]